MKEIDFSLAIVAFINARNQPFNTAKELIQFQRKASKFKYELNKLMRNSPLPLHFTFDGKSKFCFDLYYSC
jgi:hypothetical protein